MKTIKVYGTRSKGKKLPMVSWIIRLVEWSDISHSAVEINDKIYHAHFNEVKFESKEDFEKEHDIIHTWEFQIPVEMHDAMVDWCEGFKGIKQGYMLKLIGVFIPLVLRKLFGVYIKNLLVNGMDKCVTCAELTRFLAMRFWSFQIPKKPCASNFSIKDFKKMMDNNIG